MCGREVRGVGEVWARGGGVGEVWARGLGEASARGDARPLDERGDGEAAEEGHEGEHSVQVLRGEVRAYRRRERHVRDTSESRRGHEGRGRHEPMSPPDMTLLAAMARSAKATLERRPRHLRDTR